MKEGTPFCDLNTFEIETVIVGSGASGYNTYDSLLRLGYTDAVLISEHIKGGTSRNTGSDKQTYYKLSLSGSDHDSVHDLAKDLFAGGCVDGDIALCEAANSVRGFMKLVELGVPFPANRYGEFIGYKTDHDPYRRATSAGPYTSRFMTEALERSATELGGVFYDGVQVVRILTESNEVRGVLCLSLESNELFIIWCRNLVLATGGPAVLYKDSVYPESQFGASGIAFEAGCIGRNLTEWQYGLSSIAPRWNVSGTYMQSLPRFFSMDEDGVEYDFLQSWFDDPYEMMGLIFLKGYQWPFDVRKIDNQSSLLDLIVYEEVLQGRTVFLDFRSNPIDIIDYERLPRETYEYLYRANALKSKPIDRLREMNEPAYQFYLDHGVDLARDPLQINLCAQHNNGGIAVDVWYRSSVTGIFAVGEAAATHGVYRPGGSALNAGQVGSFRVAQYIHRNRRSNQSIAKLSTEDQVQEIIRMTNSIIKGVDTIHREFEEVQESMSLFASVVREPRQLHALRLDREQRLAQIENVSLSSTSTLSTFFHYRDCLIAQITYLYAMEDFLTSQGGSRGSALYIMEEGSLVCSKLPTRYKSVFDDLSQSSRIQEISYVRQTLVSQWRKPNPIPREDDFFENVWRTYREHGNVY